MNYCAYYQAQIISKDVWFVVGTLRSFEHLAFDRTLDKANSIFEFFVPENNEKNLVELLDHFKKIGLITYYSKLENRLLDPSETV